MATAWGTDVRAWMIACTEECLMRGRAHCTITAQWVGYRVIKGKHLGGNGAAANPKWVKVVGDVSRSARLYTFLTVLSEISQDSDRWPTRNSGWKGGRLITLRKHLPDPAQIYNSGSRFRIIFPLLQQTPTPQHPPFFSPSLTHNINLVQGVP